MLLVLRNVCAVWGPVEEANLVVVGLDKWSRDGALRRRGRVVILVGGCCWRVSVDGEGRTLRGTGSLDSRGSLEVLAWSIFNQELCDLSVLDYLAH